MVFCPVQTISFLGEFDRASSTILQSIFCPYNTEVLTAHQWTTACAINAFNIAIVGNITINLSAIKRHRTTSL
jgi:hypothetical protein